MAFPLLLTATITPPDGVPFLSRVDPQLRLSDYAHALAFYLTIPEHLIDRIVFVDNSASDLSALQAVVSAANRPKDVELIAYDGLDYPVAYGRSVGETRLINDALRQSRILRGLGEDEIFWKITGRLRARNIARLVASTPAGCSLYADFRRYRRPLLDTRLFAVTPAGFRRLLLSRLELMRQDLLPSSMVSPEERLYWGLLPELRRGGIVPRLRCEAWVEGHSGFGENYGRTKRKVESSIRTVTRRIVPRLWI